MRAGQIFSLAICAAITLGFTVTAIWCLFQPKLWIASLIFVPFIGVMAWLTRAVWREARGIAPPDLLQPDPHQPDVLVWHGSRMRAWGSLAMAVFCALFAIGFVGLVPIALTSAGIAFGEQLAMAFFMALVALVFGGLTSLIWRNGIGFLGASAALRPDGLRLKLPRYRSLIHRPPKVDLLYKWDAIAGIETRLEAYQSQLLAMLQRPYWLVLKDGTRVFLFEDRGIDSPQATRSLDPVASAICEKAGGKWREMPMAEGRGGFLGAWHTAAPAQGAPPLSSAREGKLLRRVAFTGRVAGYAVSFVILARALAWLVE